ncbi:MAG TPA: xanthine dehydrogenase molybdopterin binding subunit [Bacteroidales bacterium]|nr:MAG: xanthine dehydrogenase molybdopterin binding subunit [Bacteroidetes bacterium GWE2_42_24]OFY26468.1 MAG: xanthine dehydrogenase molybdopterin binding subunit [Bacteroidetes bacterium GWF2_43_11]HBZ68130.1 xanthine dehydrogenase molybdopterin binding subunit [Bacteroidales bacterium]
MNKASSLQEPSPTHHDSALRHVTGQSQFIDDMAEPAGTLHGAVYFSKWASGRIVSYDLEKAAKLPGVAAIIDFTAIGGDNQMGPVVHDEPCLADGNVTFRGQAIFLVAARSREISRRALASIQVKVEERPGIFTIDKAIEENSFLGPARKICTGNPDEAFDKCDHVIYGELFTAGQEHWYLETQSALCIPGEEGRMTVYASTQNPTETQAIVSEVLGVSRHSVTVVVKRMGGAFGGKETQGNHVAAWAAILAQHTGKPIKMRLTRDEDQKVTGKRHPFRSNWQAGFTSDGMLIALKANLFSDGGAATDLSWAIMERAMFHVDNAYYIPNLEVNGRVCFTNLPSNTAFRGFGGPQGMAITEQVMNRIALLTGLDPVEVRRRNLYGTTERNITHYGQRVDRNPMEEMAVRLMDKGDYISRMEGVDAFNKSHRHIRRGLAMMPVKFGISFTTTFLNQAGALVNIYQDGSVVIHHGGTEMGQGLNTKIIAVAATELGISAKRIVVEPTNTMVVPNTSATAASSGSDLNGMAVRDAAAKLRNRLSTVACRILGEQARMIVSPADLMFDDDYIRLEQRPEMQLAFTDLVKQAYLNQVSLSATGYYRTPGIWYDKEQGRGKPFHYFAFGMALAEVEVDLLTGDVRTLRADILHDVGNSLHRTIDLGQIQGAFVQGIGWCTTEELRYSKDGELLNFSPDTYKIPTIDDIPVEFNIDLFPTGANPGTIHGSKAVGEPPFMLALSVWLAIQYALQSVAPEKVFSYSLPATNEKIVKWVEELRAD